MSADEPLLELDEVSVHYADESAVMEVIPQQVKDRFGWNPTPVRAVDDVSLEIGEEEVIAVVGESGSGKTTLGKAAVGLQEPTSGHLRYRGTDFWELKRQTRLNDMFFEDARKALQIVHQDPRASLNPYRQILAQLKEPLRRWYPELSNSDYRERIFGLFERCGLTPAHEYEDRYPHELSGGEKQRVTLIRAMLCEPDVILADEPVGALDTSLRIELMDLMLDLKDEFGTSFMFITHSLETARYIAGMADGGELAVMYLGEVVEHGPVEEVLNDPQHPYTQVLRWGSLPMHPDKARAELQTEAPLRKLDVPDTQEIPSGCRFHTRCPKAREVCQDEHPELVSDDGHSSACFRALPDHEYWDSEYLDEEGEIDIPV